jgi:hypothetical protein
MIYHIVIGVMLTNLAIRMIVDPSLPKQPTHGVANLSFFFDQSPRSKPQDEYIALEQNCIPEVWVGPWVDGYGGCDIWHMFLC